MGRDGERGETDAPRNGPKDTRRGLRDAGQRETHTEGRAQKARDGEGERLGRGLEGQRQGGRRGARTAP